MESKGEAARENQTNCAKVVDVVDRFFELTESKAEATQENPAPSSKDTKGKFVHTLLFYQIEPSNWLRIVIDDTFLENEKTFWDSAPWIESQLFLYGQQPIN